MINTVSELLRVCCSDRDSGGQSKRQGAERCRGMTQLEEGVGGRGRAGAKESGPPTRWSRRGGHTGEGDTAEGWGAGRRLNAPRSLQ